MAQHFFLAFCSAPSLPYKEKKCKNRTGKRATHTRAIGQCPEMASSSDPFPGPRQVSSRGSRLRAAGRSTGGGKGERGVSCACFFLGNQLIDSFFVWANPIRGGNSAFVRREDREKSMFLRHFGMFLRHFRHVFATLKSFSHADVTVSSCELLNISRALESSIFFNGER